VSEEFLHGLDVIAGLQAVGGKGADAPQAPRIRAPSSGREERA
jgi:hypothetical protein